MAKASRDKGKRGEREIIDILQPIVDAAYREAGREPPQLKRTSSMQADGGGCDVHGIDWLALEVKRCETLQLEAWWRQCLSQTKPDQLPALCYRQSHCAWRVRMLFYPSVVSLNTPITVDMSMADFCIYFAALLRYWLAQERRG